MKCVIITLTYPFGNGDPFLREEIPVIAKDFDQIVIIPLTKEDGDRDNLPANVKMLSSNQSSFLASVKTIASFRKVMKEVRFGSKMGYKNIIKMVHRAMTYEYKYYISIKALENIETDDTVFYSYWLSEPAYLLARYKTINPYITCVSRAHGYDCFKDRGYNPFRREIAENLDCIYSISEKGKTDLETNLVNLSRNNHKTIIKLSHLGVKTTNDINPVIGEDGLFRLVSCSNVVEVKRLDILAKALSLVSNKGKKIEWIHFGDGELLDNLKKQIAGYSLSEEKVVSFMGAVNHDIILQYYQTIHVDLFVNCSDAEGIPVSIMEAMEYGIPCMGRNVGGIQELIDDQKNGFLLPQMVDPQTIADIIENVMEKGISEEMRCNAKKKIQNDFCSDKNYHAFSQELINSYRCKGVMT